VVHALALVELAFDVEQALGQRDAAELVRQPQVALVFVDVEQLGDVLDARKLRRVDLGREDALQDERLDLARRVVGLISETA